MRSEIGNWIASAADFDTFITVTLKQGVVNGSGVYSAFNRSDIDRTARVLSDRVSNRVCGSKPTAQGKRLSWVTFVENGKGTKRWHLHILAKRPVTLSADTFAEIVEGVCQRMQSIRDRIDIRSIDNSTGSRSAIFYSLKEGDDAFCPTASHLPCTASLVDYA